MAGVLIKRKEKDGFSSIVSPEPNDIKKGNIEDFSIVEVTPLSNSKSVSPHVKIQNNDNHKENKGLASLGEHPLSSSEKLLSAPKCPNLIKANTPHDSNSKQHLPHHLPKLQPEPRNNEIKKRHAHKHKEEKSECYQFRNQEDFCEAVCEARVTKDYEEIQAFLEKLYSSYNELIKAFKLKKSNKNEADINLDSDYLDYVHESVIRMPKDIQKTLLRSIINCMLQDRRGQRSADELRAFLILLLNPLFAESSTYVIFAHVLRQVALLSNHDHHYLMTWFKKLPVKEYKHIIERIRTFIGYRLFPTKNDIPEGEKSSWWIPNGVKVLALLNAANDQTIPLMVPRSTFYVKGVELLDLIREYQMWQTGSSNFSFCQYPFVLSLYAKRYIMQKDSETKMLLEARQSLVKKVRQKQQPNMGMLFLNLNIRRNFLLEDSLKEISMKQSDLKKKLRVIFTGEPGIDLGGVSKEWFFLIMQRFFKADYGMFKYNNKTHVWWFNASCKDNYQEFNLCGVLMGLAMYNGINLDIRFPPCLYKKLLSPAIVPYNNPHAPVGIAPMGFEDFKYIYPDLAKGLKELLDYDGDVEEDLCQSFQVSYTELGQVVTRNLKPQGETVPVTNQNRQEYVNLYIDYLLNKCIYQQFYSFYHGFHSVCASNALLLLRPEEVETLVIGNPEFNISDLEKVTAYDGYKKSDVTIRNFWDVVYDFNQKMQRKLLLFSTGSDRMPIGGAIEMKFKITRIGGRNATQMLPMAHTCFNQLCLPAYKSRKVLQKKLSIAIENAEGFGLE